MRIFRSGNSSLQKPPQAVGAEVPKPKSMHRIRELLSFGHPHKHKPPRDDSSNPIVVLSSSHPSLELSPSLQVSDDPVPVAYDSPNNYASPSGQFPQLSTSLNTVQMLHTSGPITPPSHHKSPFPTADPSLDEGRDLLIVPQPPSATSSQLSLHSQIPIIPAREHSPHPRDGNSYRLQAGQDIRMIQESRNVYVDGNNSNVNYTNNFVNNSTKFMAELLQETIRGAAFDSSARDPPPRCHPGTRLAILERCLKFVATAAGERKMLWVVGHAGVGKSAVMQTIAESPLPSVSERASIFLSINGRNDGTKVVMTLVYQLADECEAYRQFVEHEITRHPSLLQSSMSVQFKKLLIKPFIDTTLSNSVDRILILVDGLDECDKPETQCELLRLITETCSAHPSSPIVWIIASRPEHHITSFFVQGNVHAVYEKEEIQVDSDEARRDVEQFLRAELRRIQKQFSLSPGSQWPREQDFWKLASAAGGLFVYAHTVTKYIGSLAIGDPISQLNDVLKVIDALPLSDVPREQHPLVLLDALYARILSKVPKRIMVNARRILLALVLDSRRGDGSWNGNFLTLCNWLGVTYDDAYTAIRHLGSVLDAPTRDEAHEKKLRPFHKSFIDYVSDFTRSGFSSDIEHEAHQLEVQYTIRILKQAPGGMDCATMLLFPSGSAYGMLTRVPGGGSNIVLTWSGDQDKIRSDNQMRSEMYKRACSNVVEGIKTGHSVFHTEFYICMVITQLWIYTPSSFPHWELLTVVFDKSRCHEFIKSGISKRVPIQEPDFTGMTLDTNLRFWCPSGTTTNQSDLWNPSCKHKQNGDWGEDENKVWTTKFGVDKNSDSRCDFCCQRLEQQLKYWKTRSSGHDITILLTSAQISYVEFHFIDPDDGVSEWTYWIIVEIPHEKRRKPGSIV